jgi:lysozyme family protein
VSDLFDQLIGPLLAVEGGYSNNKADAGGETNWGVTAAVARENGYGAAIAVMTREQAAAIYRAKYWAKPGLYLVAPLSPKIAAELFDTGVNMGTGTAAIFLQRSLNALNEQGKDFADIAVDGGIGPCTAAALKDFLAKRGVVGEQVMLTALNCLQGARYIELAESRAANEAFEFGWLAARVSPAA